MNRRSPAVPALGILSVLAGCAGGARTPGGPPPDDAVNVNIAFPIEEMDLPNGLHVVLHREPSAPSALVHVRYNVGSKDDPQGRSGFAHLYEHLMFKGSKNTGTKDYMQWLADVGGDSNAFTTRDATDYFAYVPPSALPRAIWLEADRMAYPIATVDEESFTRERDVVKNEWRQHYEDVPLGNLESIAREAIFGISHPYGTSTIGRAEELDKSTLAEARAFARAYYRPNNATLVVCGVFDVAATKQLVSRYFATIPPGPVPLSRVIPPAKLEKAQRIDVAAGIDGPAVMLAWPAPPTHGDGYEEIGFGLGYVWGHVHRRLITEKKIANDVSVHYTHGRLGGLVMITIKLKPGAAPNEAIDVVDEYLTQASRLGRLYTWDLLKSYKTRALVNEVAGLEGLEGRAERILHDLEEHGAVNSVQGDLRRLLAVDAADVGAAVERFMSDAPRVTIVVKPTPGAPRSGRKVSP